MCCCNWVIYSFVRSLSVQNSVLIFTCTEFKDCILMMPHMLLKNTYINTTLSNFISGDISLQIIPSNKKSCQMNMYYVTTK